MSALLLKIIFLGVSAVLGASAGWWIRGAGLSRPKIQPSPEPKDTPAPQPRPAKEDDAEFDQLDAMMGQLHQLTNTVAADVGEHNTIVQEINDELASGGATEASVLAVVEKLIKANDVMQGQLAQAEERLQEQAAEMETHVKEARTDALTKLWNRRHFDDEMQKCKSAFRTKGTPSCVMMMDVDHFKKFNDTYGHQAGDEVLRGVARTLRKNATGNEVVCRYGGEEFAIIFPGRKVGDAIPIGEQARAAIAEQVFAFEGLDLKVSMSAGLAEMQHEETVEALVKRSDDALYVCKEAGRNNGHWHDGEKSHPMALDAVVETKTEPTSSSDEQPGRIAGVSDRKTFLTDVERRIAEFKRGGSKLSVLLVQIDRYDAIANQYGDKATEVVLRAGAQFLKAAMREMDHIARYEQEVFGLLLPGAELTETTAVAERLRAAISRCTLPLNEDKITFTVSLGAAQVSAQDETQDLLGRAQAALDSSNSAGGNNSFAATESGDIRSMALSS